MTNVALVVLDTLRKDRFEEHFSWLPGRRFENAWSPSHWTVPVHAAMFAGRYPSELGIHAKAEHLDCGRTVLAEQFAAAGYRTRAFSGNPYVSPVFGYDRGFDEFEGSWRLRHLDPDLFDWNDFVSRTDGRGPTRYLRAVWECLRGDCATVPSLRYGAELKLRDLGLGSLGDVEDDGAQAALEYVRTTDFGDEEFLFVNLMEAHAPYDPPGEYRTGRVTRGPGLEATLSDAKPDVDVAVVERAYDDAVRYLADMYERIFAELRESFDLVITVSDHGELFGEHGAWKHVHGLFPELTHVPLTVYDVSGNGGRSDATVGLIDVHRTVLSAAGIDTDSRGQDLRDPASREYLTEYHGLRTRQVEKLRRSGIDPDRIEQYERRLNGVALPGGYYGYETDEGFVETGTTAGDPRERLADLRLELDPAPENGATGREELPPDVVNQLDELGYL